VRRADRDEPGSPELRSAGRTGPGRPARPEPAPIGAGSGLLELQRLAGNRAVTRLLRARAAAPVVQRDVGFEFEDGFWHSYMRSPGMVSSAWNAAVNAPWTVGGYVGGLAGLGQWALAYLRFAAYIRAGARGSMEHNL